MGVVSLLACGALGGVILSQSAALSGNVGRPSDSLPQDQHEGVTISVDSYSDANRAKKKFGKADPLPVGILPVEVFLSNSTTQPIRIDIASVQLDVHFEDGRRQSIDWLPISEVARAIAHPNGPSNPHPPRFPVGVPNGADTKSDKVVEILRPLALEVTIIPPMATMHGFLFFDMNHNMPLANRARLYVPNMTNVPEKKPLMFFEVPLGKA